MSVNLGGNAGWGYSFPPGPNNPGDFFYRIDLAGWYYYHLGVWTLIPSAGGGDTITSPNSTITVGGTSTATTLDIDLATPNTWTGLQTFGTEISILGEQFSGSSPSTNQVIQFNGTNWVAATISSGGISGSGTAGTMAKFTGSTAIGNSSITDSGTLVTISPTTEIAFVPTGNNDVNLFDINASGQITVQNGAWMVFSGAGLSASPGGQNAILSDGSNFNMYIQAIRNLYLQSATPGTYHLLVNMPIGIEGSSTGYTYIQSGLSGSSNNTLTLPTTSSDTLAAIGTAQTWSALQTFGNNISIGGVPFSVSGAAKGDIIYNNGTDWANLAIGTTGQVLTVASGLPSWASGGGGAVSSVSNSDGTLTISPTTGSVVASLALGHANTWTALQQFTKGDLALLGTSTGYTLLESGLASTSNNTLLLPTTSSDTLAALGTVETFTVTQTFNSTSGASVVLSSAAASSGTTTVNSTALDMLGSYWNGSSAVPFGFRLYADVSATTPAGYISFNKNSNGTVTELWQLNQNGFFISDNVSASEPSGSSVAYFGASSGGGWVFSATSNSTGYFAFKTNGSTKFIVNGAGIVSTYDQRSTTGNGVPAIFASYSTTGQTGAVSNAINYTPPSTAGTYRMGWSVDVTTATTLNFTIVATWKDASGNSISQTLGGFDKSGNALVAGAITNTIGTGVYYGSVVFSINNGGTAITLSTSGTFTSVVYNLTATLEQLA